MSWPAAFGVTGACGTAWALRILSDLHQQRHTRTPVPTAKQPAPCSNTQLEAAAALPADAAALGLQQSTSDRSDQSTSARSTSGGSVYSIRGLRTSTGAAAGVTGRDTSVSSSETGDSAASQLDSQDLQALEAGTAAPIEGTAHTHGLYSGADGVAHTVPSLGRFHTARQMFALAWAHSVIGWGFFILQVRLLGSLSAL